MVTDAKQFSGLQFIIPIFLVDKGSSYFWVVYNLT